MKAILVIDMPTSCNTCQFCTKENSIDWYCERFDDYVDAINGKYHREAWCPLKPMPKKKETDSTGTIEEYMLKGYDRGWNDCIDKILGEQNGNI